jgi:hypothetical protein
MSATTTDNLTVSVCKGAGGYWAEVGDRANPYERPVHSTRRTKTALRAEALGRLWLRRYRARTPARGGDAGRGREGV